MRLSKCLLAVFVSTATACGDDAVEAACAEIGEACHDAAEDQGEGSLALECHELEGDATKSAEDCEAMRADCEAACAATTPAE